MLIFIILASEMVRFSNYLNVFQKLKFESLVLINFSKKMLYRFLVVFLRVIFKQLKQRR